ncbi:MAG TPA: hypothetical protein VMU13_01425 [Candidatus Paceibacterota bacterium]|nr:hypothetical protein [Candidatus Paceibacterota bacterium]
MRKSIIATLSLASAFALPMLAGAQGAVVASPQQGIIGLISWANTALNDVMVLFITLAIVVFFWGLIKYIMTNNTGGEGRAQALSIIFYSIIAIFIMVSIWGIIHILQATFGVGNASLPETPGQIRIPTQ